MTARGKTKNKLHEDNNHNAPPSKRRRISMYDNTLQDYYECPICYEIPSAKIYQCRNGHIICEDCHCNPNFDKKCAKCRCEMSLPIRALPVEQFLALRKVQCPNYNDGRGCTVDLKFGDLDEHIQSKCKYEMVSCKYKRLGCDWKGVRTELNDHKSKCEPDKDYVLQLLRKQQTEINILNVMSNCEHIRVPDLNVDHYNDLEKCFEINDLVCGTIEGRITLLRNEETSDSLMMKVIMIPRNLDAVHDLIVVVSPLDEHGNGGMRILCKWEGIGKYESDWIEIDTTSFTDIDSYFADPYLKLFIAFEKQ